MAPHSTARRLLRRFAVSLYGAPPGFPVAAFCALLAARGIGGIGLTPDAVSMMEPDGLTSLLARYDVRASSLNSAGYLLHADAQAAATQARLEARLFDAAVALDAPVNVIPGGLLHAGPTAAGLDPRSLRALTRDRLAELTGRAASRGISLSLEPMHPMALGLRSCLNQVSAARSAIAALPGFGLTLDLFHSHWDDGVGLLLEEAPDLLRLVQVCGVSLPRDGSSPQRTALGHGEIDVAAFLAALDAAGYRGMIEYEVFFDAMGAPAPEALLDAAVAGLLALAGAM